MREAARDQLLARAVALHPAGFAVIDRDTLRSASAERAERALVGARRRRCRGACIRRDGDRSTACSGSSTARPRPAMFSADCVLSHGAAGSWSCENSPAPLRRCGSSRERQRSGIAALRSSQPARGQGLTFGLSRSGRCRRTAPAVAGPAVPGAAADRVPGATGVSGRKRASRGSRHRIRPRTRCGPAAAIVQTPQLPVICELCGCLSGRASYVLDGRKVSRAGVDRRRLYGADRPAWKGVCCEQLRQEFRPLDRDRAASRRAFQSVSDVLQSRAAIDARLFRFRQRRQSRPGRGRDDPGQHDQRSFYRQPRLYDLCPE